MPIVIDFLKRIQQPWITEAELPRRCFKIVHVALNLICFGIAVAEYTTFYENNTSEPKDDQSSQNWSRVSFIGITLANSIVSMGVLIMHFVSRRNDSYALVPSSEAWYFMISAALLIIVSSFLARYRQLSNVDNSELIIPAVVCGFIDAVMYIVPAVQIWRGRRVLSRV